MTGSRPKVRRRHGQPAPTIPPPSPQRSTNPSCNAAAAPARRDPHRPGFSRGASIPPDEVAKWISELSRPLLRDGTVLFLGGACGPRYNYLRRAVLDPTRREGRLLERLTELAHHEVSQLRATGYASTTRSESSQVISVMVRQLGHLFLQPMIDAMWRQLAEPGATDADKPSLEVRARSSSWATGAVT